VEQTNPLAKEGRGVKAPALFICPTALGVFEKG
jgi:hypothetical protein